MMNGNVLPVQYTSGAVVGEDDNVLKEGKENIARIANAVLVTLYSRVTMNVKIVVLNC